METIEKLITKLLAQIDSHPDREGLDQTPLRYKKFLQEFLHPEKFEMTCFESEGYSEMVVQKHIPFYSICEHHLVPFFGHGTIAYIPDRKLVGLSKLARTLDLFCRKLQNQERITSEVAQHLSSALEPKGVAVSLTARHLCMEMRGIQKTNVETTTTTLSGVFKTKAATRNEFLHLSKQSVK